MNPSLGTSFCSPHITFTRRGKFSSPLNGHARYSSKRPCCLASAEKEMISIKPTPLEPIVFRGHVVHVKRDDTLAFGEVMGSKLRKFYSLLQPDALQAFDGIVSYGGAQSNAMIAMASLCSYHGKQFIYATKTVSKGLLGTPGNYSKAKDAGMMHLQLTNEEFRDCFTDKDHEEARAAANALLMRRNLSSQSGRYLFIPQGGAWEGAEEGVKILANELQDQIELLRESGELSRRKPILFLPAGTGTTAFFLQKHLHDVVRVVAVPVSGDERYLVKQMRWLHKLTDVEQTRSHAPLIPDVIRPRYRSTFADITSRKLSIWRELTRATNGNIIFDLVYAPKAWEEVMLAVAEGRLGKHGENLLYYDSGGLEGNQSMLGKSAAFWATHADIVIVPTFLTTQTRDNDIRSMRASAWAPTFHIR